MKEGRRVEPASAGHRQGARRRPLALTAAACLGIALAAVLLVRSEDRALDRPEATVEEVATAGADDSLQFRDGSTATRPGRLVNPQHPEDLQRSAPGESGLIGSIILALLDIEGPFSAEELASLESELAALREAGAMAVPQIRQLLDSRVDRVFDPASAASFGHSTFRLALIGLLAEIGGIEAELLLAEQLGNFQSLHELEALANALESLQPGFYTEAFLDLAGEQLALVFEKQPMEEQSDTAPLFRIFQRYGDASTAAMLARAPRWLRFYAQLALAELPDGGGIEAIIRHAQRDVNATGDGSGLQLLAQSAASSPDAQAALLFLAEAGGIPDAYWPAISEILMGDRQLQTENPALSGLSLGSVLGGLPYTTHTVVDRQVQTVYSVNYSAALSPAQVELRIALLLRLVEVTDSPVGFEYLWAAYNALSDHYTSTPGG